MKINVRKWLLGCGVLLSSVSAFADTTNIQNIPQVLIQNLDAVGSMMQALFPVLGFTMLGAGLLSMHRYGAMRTNGSSQMSMSKPLALIGAAACMLSLQSTISILLFSFWGQDTPLVDNPLAGSTDSLAQFYQPIMMFVSLFGIGTLMHGIVSLGKAGNSNSQPGAVGKAMIKIFASILLIHVQSTMYLIEIFFGLNFSF